MYKPVRQPGTTWLLAVVALVSLIRLKINAAWLVIGVCVPVLAYGSLF